MALINDVRNESDRLIQQLAGLQYIIETNRDGMNKYFVTLEFLAFKMDVAQSFIEELQSWEMLGNQGKCDSAMDGAQFFLEQARVLLDRVLDEQCEDAWLDSQRELRFSSYASSKYEYVLGTNEKAYPSCLAA